MATSNDGRTDAKRGPFANGFSVGKLLLDLLDLPVFLDNLLQLGMFASIALE